MTILFEEGTPVVAYTNLIGARAGQRWTPYRSCSSLNAVPIGDKGDALADAHERLLGRGATPISYPPCEPGGSTRPAIVKHPCSTYSGPGRITEKGVVVNDGAASAVCVMLLQHPSPASQGVDVWAVSDHLVAH